MKIEPIKKISVSEQISNRIQELITSGTLKPGEKLPSERELCIQFNVSRTSVREALKGLLSTGLLEKRKDGTYIRKSIKDILIKPMQILLTSKGLTISEIFEARIILETQNAKLAALKATEDDLYQMSKCIEIMTNPDSTIEEKMDSSVEFHNLISKATKNKVLYDMYQVIYSILDRMRNQSDTIKNLEKSIISHVEIYEKIKARDETGAERVMQSHISKLFKNYKDDNLTLNQDSTT